MSEVRPLEIMHRIKYTLTPDRVMREGGRATLPAKHYTTVDYIY